MRELSVRNVQCPRIADSQEQSARACEKPIITMMALEYCLHGECVNFQSEVENRQYSLSNVGVVEATRWL